MVFMRYQRSCQKDIIILQYYHYHRSNNMNNNSNKRSRGTNIFVEIYIILAAVEKQFTNGTINENM